MAVLEARTAEIVDLAAKIQCYWENKGIRMIRRSFIPSLSSATRDELR